MRIFNLTSIINVEDANRCYFEVWIRVGRNTKKTWYNAGFIPVPTLIQNFHGAKKGNGRRSDI